jgi:inosine/xanthosine triphosphatase
MRIGVGSANPAKLAAVRASIERISSLVPAWSDIEVIGKNVETGVSAMPLTDEELMSGARTRALAVRDLLTEKETGADLYVGLEGGFHTVDPAGRRHTFLKGWAYVTDGRHGSFGASPSIIVPDAIVHSVVGGGRELAEVIDEVAGQQDVRSRQGAWGVLSRDLFTRAMSFEVALVAAFAPFYNREMYDGQRARL